MHNIVSSAKRSSRFAFELFKLSLSDELVNVEKQISRLDFMAERGSQLMISIPRVNIFMLAKKRFYLFRHFNESSHEYSAINKFLSGCELHKIHPIELLRFPIELIHFELSPGCCARENKKQKQINLIF